MKELLQKASELIHRDIVFAQSLYVQQPQRAGQTTSSKVTA